MAREGVAEGVKVSSIGIKWFLDQLMAFLQIGARVSRREIGGGGMGGLSKK